MAKNNNAPNNELSNELSNEQIEAAKAMLMAAAETQYKKTTKSVKIMEEFSKEITALRKTGHPWTAISSKLKDATKVSISATTLRIFFTRGDGGTAKKTRHESVSAEPNIFADTTPAPQAG